MVLARSGFLREPPAAWTKLSNNKGIAKISFPPDPQDRAEESLLQEMVQRRRRASGACPRVPALSPSPCTGGCCHQAAAPSITGRFPPRRSRDVSRPELPGWVTATAQLLLHGSKNTSDPNCFESPKKRRIFKASKLTLSDLFINKIQPGIFFSSLAEEHNR